MATLYGWVTPAFISGAPADHTWVTTYDSRVTEYENIGSVVAASEDYWFSWGSFHRKGSPPAPLCDGPGDLALARCLCLPNLDSRWHLSARGTIFIYGVDGACHQLSNQILYATSVGGAKPLTVAGARWYWASVAIYGAYGVNYPAWAARVESCAATTGTGGGGAPSMTILDDPDDSSLASIRAAVSGPDAEMKLDALRALRDNCRELLNQFRDAGVRNLPAEAVASEMNRIINQYFIGAAKVLSAEEYERAFGFRPGEVINLVNPEMLPGPKQQR